MIFSWRFTRPNTWTLTDNVQCRGWVTGHFREDGTVLGFKCWHSDRDGTMEGRQFASLARAQEEIRTVWESK